MLLITYTSCVGVNLGTMNQVRFANVYVSTWQSEAIVSPTHIAMERSTLLKLHFGTAIIR